MRLWTILLLLPAFAAASGTAVALDPPPPIGPFAIDLRGTLPKFPNTAALADSRGLRLTDLPGRGIGADAGVHVYPFRVGVVTVGLGARLTLVRSRLGSEGTLPAVTGRFTSMAPQLSFNFGTGNGWSYISGGIGRSRWSIVPDGRALQ